MEEECGKWMDGETLQISRTLLGGVLNDLRSSNYFSVPSQIMGDERITMIGFFQYRYKNMNTIEVRLTNDTRRSVHRDLKRQGLHH